MEALPAAPVLTPAPRENECYGITKPSYISRCRHLGVVPAGCLPATYHTLRAQHNIPVPPVPLCSLSSCSDFCRYLSANSPCLLYSPGPMMRQRCLSYPAQCLSKTLLSSSQMCEFCSTMTIFSGKVQQSKSRSFIFKRGNDAFQCFCC